MISFPIPPDYSPLREALRRASDTWGSMDAFNKLKGVLRFGKLDAYRLDQSGSVTAYAAEMWANPKNDYLLRVPNPDRVETREKEYATVFLTHDLIRELPDSWEQADAQIAERKAQRAETAANVTQVVNSKSKGGRLTEHDWSSIWIEMCVYVDREGVPNNYAALVNFIESWFHTKHKNRPSPVRSEIHLRAKLLIDRMLIERGRPPIT